MGLWVYNMYTQLLYRWAVINAKGKAEEAGGGWCLGHLGEVVRVCGIYDGQGRKYKLGQVLLDEGCNTKKRKTEKPETTRSPV